ncbi:MAG: M48 family metallopeptidase [Candidatus Melainabacteria bacterium]|nr:M48 family metallopeptidase [Candidatus Melainabacteria bacterium]
MPKKSIKQVGMESAEYAAIGDRAVLEMYQAFMAGYVKRINDATFGVTIGGVKIGSAKYTRLAQINLRSRVITFSRFAVENVPERGRRYLVLHELAHVKEYNHNQKFWGHVERFEPDYRQVGKSLQSAFTKNVREDQQKRVYELLKNPVDGQIETAAKILGARLMNNKTVESLLLTSQSSEEAIDEDSGESYECMEDEFSMWDESAVGTINGGSDEDEY